MKERAISEEFIRQALEHPTKTTYDTVGRLLIRKIYERRGTRRLLLIVAEQDDETLRIVTVIDTSKVRKYL